MMLPQWVVAVYVSAAVLPSPPLDQEGRVREAMTAMPVPTVPVVLMMRPQLAGAGGTVYGMAPSAAATAPSDQAAVGSCGGSAVAHHWGMQPAGTTTPHLASRTEPPQQHEAGRRAAGGKGGASYVLVADEDNFFPPLAEVPQQGAEASATTPALLWTPEEAGADGAHHPNDIRNIYPLPRSPPLDLGPQRPHGQFPPDAGPAYVVDLGPQRPHGQFPPSDDAVELKALHGGTGPHRPAGPRDPNLPPGGDLGPQRPHGQFPPNDAVVQDAVVQDTRSRWRPVDLGPHRPAGNTDPNGPPGSNGPVDLGPQRPSGQFPPGVTRPQPQADVDLGPHRPAGQTDPNLPSAGQQVQDDDDAAASFRVYWNVPSFMCHKYGLPFSNLSGRYGMVQNEDDVFRGTKIAILYDPGLFPALVDSDGTTIARNGGVPQEGNLELHLQRLQASIEDQVPEDFDGLGVIDFEAWRPVWAQNFGTLKAYQAYSIQVERTRSPLASNSTLTARATRRFEAAAKVFFLRSLALAQRIRPNGRWGYYAFPYCFNSNDDNFDCSDNLRSQNSRIQWLFDASTALYPSVYLSQSGRDRDDEFLFIQAKLKEAARVAQGRNVVYPYLWYRYRDAAFLSDDDLRSSLALPRALDFAGAIMWGSSSDMNTQSKCQTLDTQLEDRLGPEILKFSVTLSEERVKEYVQGRNASATASRSTHRDDFQFPDQRALQPLQYATL